MRAYPELDLPALLTELGVAWRGAGGWIQLACPKCGDEGWHMGWHGRGFYCWRCGRLNTKEVLETLGATEDALKRARNASNTGGASLPPPPTRSPRLARSRPIAGLATAPLRAAHRQYLRKRDFSVGKLVQTWDLSASRALGGPLAWRIIIPYKGSDAWQARAIGDEKQPRYLSSGPEVKALLYGAWRAAGDAVVVVEGPTKVWRLGPGAVSTAGARTTPEQVMALRRWRRVVLLADGDAVGQAGARETAERVAAIWPEKEVLLVVPDWPDVGDMPQRAANKLMIKLLTGGR